MLVLALLIRLASPVEEARELNREATVAYDVREFGEALEKYRRAYALAPMPRLLFNIGQCYRQLRVHDRAIFYFQGFLRNDPGTEHRGLVEGMIAEEHRAQASRPTRVAMPHAARPASTPAVTVDHPVYRTWWFWTAIGASAAVVAGAIAVGVVASNNNARVTM